MRAISNQFGDRMDKDGSEIKDDLEVFRWRTRNCPGCRSCQPVYGHLIRLIMEKEENTLRFRRKPILQEIRAMFKNLFVKTNM